MQLHFASLALVAATLLAVSSFPFSPVPAPLEMVLIKALGESGMMF